MAVNPAPHLLLLLLALGLARGADIIFEGVLGKCPTVCRPTISCPSALDSLGDQKLILCGFRGPMPLVCCPTAPSESGNVIEPGNTPGIASVGKPGIVGEPGSVGGEPGGAGGGPAEDVKKPDFIAPPVTVGECGRRTTRAPPTTSPAGVAPPPAAAPRTRRAVGGEVVPVETVWPWVGLVGERDPEGNIEWFCGGSLINQQWLLTALHCLLQREMNVVRLGEYDHSDANDGAMHQDFDIAKVIVNPDYVYPQGYHDLALIKLSTKVPLQERIMPVCLPWGDERARNLTGHDLTLIGWGTTLYGGKRSNTPNEVNMTVFRPEVCDQNYSQLLVYEKEFPAGIDDNFLCMGHPDGGKSACQGDSGGALMYRDNDGRFVTAGAVSRGYGCGQQLYPGVHTNLRRKAHLAWIKKTAFQ